MYTHEAIITILNRGYSDVAMDAARANGARGGTIINARGAGGKQVEKVLGLTIAQEKEIIIILCSKEERNPIMSAIVKAVGLNTLGKGICFSLPVDEVLGITLGIKNKIDEPQEKTEEQIDVPKADESKTEEKPAAEPKIEEKIEQEEKKESNE